MTMKSKNAIVSLAKTLIYALQDCDDIEFVDLISNCVASGDAFVLEEEFVE